MLRWLIRAVRRDWRALNEVIEQAKRTRWPEDLW